MWLAPRRRELGPRRAVPARDAAGAAVDPRDHRRAATVERDRGRAGIITELAADRRPRAAHEPADRDAVGAGGADRPGGDHAAAIVDRQARRRGGGAAIDRRAAPRRHRVGGVERGVRRVAVGGGDRRVDMHRERAQPARRRIERHGQRVGRLDRHGREDRGAVEGRGHLGRGRGVGGDRLVEHEPHRLVQPGRGADRGLHPGQRGWPARGAGIAGVVRTAAAIAIAGPAIASLIRSRGALAAGQREQGAACGEAIVHARRASQATCRPADASTRIPRARAVTSALDAPPIAAIWRAHRTLYFARSQRPAVCPDHAS